MHVQNCTTCVFWGFKGHEHIILFVYGTSNHLVYLSKETMFNLISTPPAMISQNLIVIQNLSCLFGYYYIR